MSTKIEWAEETWNPVTGCTPVSEGCRYCYAARFAKRLAGRHGYPRDNPFAVTVHRDRFEAPLRWRKPRRVFVCSMGDPFFEGVPERVTRTVFAVMCEASRHTFLVLTKRARRMSALCRTWDPLPENVWLGVTAETRRCADARIPYLLECPARVRFVSCEPLLEPVELMRGIDWVIAGCESGPRRRPCSPHWLADLAEQCDTLAVPLFVKQVDTGDRVSHDPTEWPAALRRREYPERGAEGKR